MKTIYLDSDYVCHATPEEGMRSYETEVFDDKCDAYINGYRLIPEGSTWVRPDGMIFKGLMVAPAVRSDTLYAKQEQYEEDSENMIPLDDVAELVELLYEDDLGVIG